MAKAPDDFDLRDRVRSVVSGVDATFARWDGRTDQGQALRRRHYGRTARSVGKRIGIVVAAVAALIVATIAFGLIVGPIGQAGLFIVALAILAILVLASAWPSEPKRVEYNEQLPTRAVVQQLESLLVRKRPALPAPALRQADQLSAHLPLLESRLSELDPLDPLAQDARRLMGKHLPELIERYERLPATERGGRDGGGLTADERLAEGLGAMRGALDEIAGRLVQRDRDALETQGRFIESRYKDPSGLQGS